MFNPLPRMTFLSAPAPVQGLYFACDACLGTTDCATTPRQAWPALSWRLSWQFWVWGQWLTPRHDTTTGKTASRMCAHVCARAHEGIRVFCVVVSWVYLNNCKDREIYHDNRHDRALIGCRGVVARLKSLKSFDLGEI